MSNSNIILSSAHNISTDAETFYRDYWVSHQAKDHHGIRVRPIEALELLKQCMDIAPKSLDLTTDYLCALLYRVINGDSQEFQELFVGLIQQIETEATEQGKVQIARSILTIHNEAEMLGLHILEPGVIQTLSALANTP